VTVSLPDDTLTKSLVARAGLDDTQQWKIFDPTRAELNLDAVLQGQARSGDVLTFSWKGYEGRQDTGNAKPPKRVYAGSTHFMATIDNFPAKKKTRSSGVSKIAREHGGGVDGMGAALAQTVSGSQGGQAGRNLRKHLKSDVAIEAHLSLANERVTAVAGKKYEIEIQGNKYEVKWMRKTETGNYYHGVFLKMLLTEMYEECGNGNFTAKEVSKRNSDLFWSLVHKYGNVEAGLEHLIDGFEAPAPEVRDRHLSEIARMEQEQRERILAEKEQKQFHRDTFQEEWRKKIRAKRTAARDMRATTNQRHGRENPDAEAQADEDDDDNPFIF